MLWVGTAGMGSRLKLAANHWMITMVAALAESMNLCQAMGLDQQQFIALLDGGPLGSAYALQKLDEMRRHQYPAGFPVRLALKDLQLVSEVQQGSRAAMPLLDAALNRFATANDELADQDLAAIYELDPPVQATLVVGRPGLLPLVEPGARARASGFATRIGEAERCCFGVPVGRRRARGSSVCVRGRVGADGREGPVGFGALLGSIRPLPEAALRGS